MCINVWLFLISILAVSICHVLTAMNSFIEQYLEIALTFFTCLGSYFLYPLHLWAVTSFYFCYVGSFMFYQSEFMLACSSSSFSSFLPSFFIFGFIGTSYSTQDLLLRIKSFSSVVVHGFQSVGSADATHRLSCNPKPHMWDLSSQTRDPTSIPWAGRRILNHQTIREVPHLAF